MAKGHVLFFVLVWLAVAAIWDAAIICAYLFEPQVLTELIILLVSGPVVFFLIGGPVVCAIGDA